MKIIVRILLFSLTLIAAESIQAQRAMTVEELAGWRRIAERKISNDGNWTAAKIGPWEGDNEVSLYDRNGLRTAGFPSVGRFEFSASSAWLVLSQTPDKALTDSMKRLKTKADKMPMNRLILFRTAAGQTTEIDSVRGFKLAQEADWLAFQRLRKDSTLIVRSLDGAREMKFPSVSEYGFAPKSGVLFFVTAGDTLGTAAGLYTLNPEKGVPQRVMAGKEYYKQITFDDRGERLAFLHCEKKDSAFRAMSLWLSEGGSEARRIAGRGHEAFPPEWVVSEHGELLISESGRRVFFGTSPESRQRDTTRLADDWPQVQVWNWNEPVQYTVQNFNKAEELKRTYRAVYDTATGKVLQLATREWPVAALGDRGNGDYVLLSRTEPYSLSSMWEARTRRDTRVLSLEDGRSRDLREADYGQPRISSGGKYAYWYAAPDSVWYTVNLATGEEVRLTTPRDFIAWDEDNDVPNYPSAHGAAGWAPDDKYLLLYDRYDIWRFDPTGAAQPVNLTRNGRAEKIRYRLIRFDPEERTVDPSKAQFLTGFNETTKGHGYYKTDFSKNRTPETLLAGNFMLSVPVKARNSDAVLYTSETYERYPELLLSDLSFRNTLTLTHEGAQQEGIRWGTAELVSWISLDGKRMEGMVFKPQDFDPNRKYPLIVNFYERYSESLYSYRISNPHRSTVDYHLYNSNDYIIFNPDVVYEAGYPGEDCYNCVMPGISMLIGQGFIDETAIGAQGHSWGAYQVAYLATRTDLFSAIEAGAPVVNMFSAYGGIRWGSGMARAFQYEHTQSRIGGTPWSHFREFTESSPLFSMDKVTTPILIMHNDNDGHVPWYQGIEYFVALKRLGKPAWLLNYTGEIHWPDKMPNRVDFQKRMFQFFNHYLKREPMPRWMKSGVPAVEQDFELGYELCE